MQDGLVANMKGYTPAGDLSQCERCGKTAAKCYAKEADFQEMLIHVVRLVIKQRIVGKGVLVLKETRRKD